MDEHADREDQVERTVAERQGEGGGVHRPRRRHRAVKPAECQQVDVDAADRASRALRGDPAEVRAEVTAHLQHARGRELVERRAPEAPPLLSGRRVALGIGVAELAGPQGLEPRGIRRRPGVGAVPDAHRRTENPASRRYCLAARGVCSVKWYMLAAATADARPSRRTSAMCA